MVLSNFDCDAVVVDNFDCEVVVFDKKNCIVLLHVADTFDKIEYNLIIFNFN
jgi:hypothetical protein